MSFKDIIGQDSAIALLKASLRHDRVAHAYIFLGPRGVGKCSVALRFAKVLNCQNSPADEPCDTCSACVKIGRLMHPDVFLIRPEKEGASIKIEQIRELIRNIGLKAFEGKKKVYIIDGADTMKHEAANALLKTLEEPPQESVLILIVKNLGALFHTIVSRSQIVRFFPLKIAEIKKILMEQYSVDAVKAHIVAHLSSGKLGEALRLSDEDIFAKRAAFLQRIVQKRNSAADTDDASKEDSKFYLDILLTWYRDILHLKLGVDPSSLVNIDKKENIISEAKALTIEYLERAITEIISTASFLEQNANPKLAMGVLGFTLQKQCV